MTASDNDQQDVNEILKNIQDERGNRDPAQVINLHNEEEHEKIMSGLSRDETDDKDPSVDAEVDKENSVDETVKIKKEQAVIVEKKPKGKLKTFAFGGLGVIALAGVAFWFIGNSGDETNSVSLPNFSNWSLLSDSKVEDPVVKASSLNSAIQQLRIDIANTVDGLAKVEQVTALQNEMKTLTMAYSQQSSKIGSLQDAISRFSEKESISTTSAEFVALKSEIDVLNGYTGDVLSKLEVVNNNVSKLKEVSQLTEELKNSNWTNHLRIKKLESNTAVIPEATNKLVVKDNASAETITWENKHTWKLKIASEKFTQIINQSTNRPLRVYKGVNVPSCGVVLDIDVTGRKVTTQHCVIGR